MTAPARRLFLAVAGFLVASPALATLFDVGPMGYHDGGALLLRVVSVQIAATMLATAVGLLGYLYWVHVIVPAPRLRRLPVQSS